MDFSSTPPDGDKMTAANKENLMDQVKQQIALANAQELLQNCLRWRFIHQIEYTPFWEKMSEKCYKKCVSKPGTALDHSEQKCIAMCMDRYMDCWNLVSRIYSSRLKSEHHRLQ